MKARFIHVHKEVNVGKLNSLTLLYGVYRTYLQTCINLLLEKRCTKMPRSRRLHFFPDHPDLTVHLRRGAEAHALSIVSSWFSLKYSTVIKKRVSRLKREGEISEARAKSLFTIGKLSLDKFRCRGCGKKGHADVVGARGILGRSEEKSITCDTHHAEVRGIVRRRYAARRRSPAFSLSKESLQDDLESRTVTVLDSNSSSKV